jgi:hypothetical protein
MEDRGKNKTAWNKEMKRGRKKGEEIAKEK